MRVMTRKYVNGISVATRVCADKLPDATGTPIAVFVPQRPVSKAEAMLKIAVQIVAVEDCHSG